MKPFYVWILIAVFSISLNACSQMEKDRAGMENDDKTKMKLSQAAPDRGRDLKEIEYHIKFKFPHGPGPVSRSKKWVFNRPVAKAILINHNSSPYCTDVKIITVENLVYVVATFQAQWDKLVYSKGKFVVTFAPSDSYSREEIKVLKEEDVEGRINCCNGLTTKGDCYSWANCSGTLLLKKCTCPECRDKFNGKSFKSNSTGHCYSTSD